MILEKITMWTMAILAIVMLIAYVLYGDVMYLIAELCAMILGNQMHEKIEKKEKNNG